MSSHAALSPAHSPAQRVNNINLNGPVVPSAANPPPVSSANPPSQPQPQVSITLIAS